MDRQTLSVIHRFESLTLAVVAANSIWIAIDVDANGSKSLTDKDLIFQVLGIEPGKIGFGGL